MNIQICKRHQPFAIKEGAKAIMHYQIIVNFYWKNRQIGKSFLEGGRGGRPDGGLLSAKDLAGYMSMLRELGNHGNSGHYQSPPTQLDQFC